MPRQRLKHQRRQHQHQHEDDHQVSDSFTSYQASIDTPSSSWEDALYRTESTHSMEADQHLYLPHHKDKEGAAVRSSYASTAVDGDNSSIHDNENEDDVFSDHSPRSSMGSLASETEQDGGKARWSRVAEVHEKTAARDAIAGAGGGAKGGAGAGAAAAAGAGAAADSSSRPQIRSPASVKATQIASPSSSSLIAGAPRSGRRSAIPTVSRIGSPNMSAQYSPKKTPPRFKKVTPPLVLLHVTLLPLRWVWGDVLNNAHPSELSDEAKTLRESWRLLQDRQGDTIQDRGILLPHPQNDFELLEERLLEAMELPLKRRARILACGHYLGPSNIMSFADDVESEDEQHPDDDDSDCEDGSGSRQNGGGGGGSKKTHWCNTCTSDIRCDALGPGKVYRVNVYASNGLLKAGAWEACWKEMERVDVELEPIIDSKIQDELIRLADPEKALEQDRSAMHRISRSRNGVGRPRTNPHPGEDMDDEEALGEESFASHQRMSDDRWREVYGTRSSTGFSQHRHQDRFHFKAMMPTYKMTKFFEMVQGVFRSLADDKRSIAAILVSLLAILALVGGGADTLSSGKHALADWGRQMMPRQVLQAFQGGGGGDSGTSGSTFFGFRYAPANNKKDTDSDPCMATPHTIEEVTCSTTTLTAGEDLPSFCAEGDEGDEALSDDDEDDDEEEEEEEAGWDGGDKGDPGKDL